MCSILSVANHSIANASKPFFIDWSLKDSTKPLFKQGIQAEKDCNKVQLRLKEKNCHDRGKIII